MLYSSAEKSKKALVSPWKETYAKDVLWITYCLFQLTHWYSLSVLETKAQVIIQMMHENNMSIFCVSLDFYFFLNKEQKISTVKLNVILVIQ